MSDAVVTRTDTISIELLRALAARFGATVVMVDPGEPIPGSFWGEPEAGLIGNQIFIRDDTPVHSYLHELCHYICMTPERRRDLHTNAGGTDGEENAVCYLQVMLSDVLPDFGRDKVFEDMDAWGYSFRLGSARDWFEQDAGDARDWLTQNRLMDTHQQLTWKTRQQEVR